MCVCVCVCVCSCVCLCVYVLVCVHTNMIHTNIYYKHKKTLYFFLDELSFQCYFIYNSSFFGSE